MHSLHTASVETHRATAFSHFMNLATLHKEIVKKNNTNEKTRNQKVCNVQTYNNHIKQTKYLLINENHLNRVWLIRLEKGWDLPNSEYPNLNSPRLFARYNNSQEIKRVLHEDNKTHTTNVIQNKLERVIRMQPMHHIYINQQRA
jgi:hypothetical protein